MKVDVVESDEAFRVDFVRDGVTTSVVGAV